MDTTSYSSVELFDAKQLGNSYMNFGTFLGFWNFFEKFSFYLVQKKSDVLSWPTYQPTMSDFRPIILDLPTYLKSDVINGRSLTITKKYGYLYNI